mgnify:FL=1
MKNTTNAKALGIIIARAIVSGDVDLARKYAATNRIGWSVAEARAIGGACRYAQTTWGAPVAFEQFI